MKFGRTIASAMLLGFFALSAQAGTATLSAPSWPQEPSEAARALEQAVRDCGADARTSLWSYGDSLHVMYLNDKGSCAYFIVQTAFQPSKCEGVNTFALALNGGSLAHGHFRNFQGHRVADLFGSYQGTALGAGLFAGAGRWEASKENGITYGDKRIAIPIPIPGGDLGLGFTSCRFSSTLSPMGKVELRSRGFKVEQARILDINDVAQLPLL